MINENSMTARLFLTLPGQQWFLRDICHPIIFTGAVIIPPFSAISWPFVGTSSSYPWCF
jgi:hypothetical protein